MALSRRKFFRTLGLGAATGAAVLPITRLAEAAFFEPPRTSEPGGPILLNSNENVFGPSPKVLEVIHAAAGFANRYPTGEADALKERIAALHNVKREQIVLGTGSNEILRVAAMALLGKGRRMVQASPAYEAPEYYASTIGTEVISIPLNKAFAHDLEAMLAQVNNNCSLVYICNPNNPTASLTPRADLETFIKKLPSTCSVIIDEAYHHYAGQHSTYKSFLDQPIGDDRVIVIRTFSKVYGLAGLRLGYAVASPVIAKRMSLYLTRINLNGIVTKAGMAALDDTDSVAGFVKRNADSRQEFFNESTARMVKPIDSHANFIMLDTHNPVESTIEHFRKRNILIGRRFPALETYIRVSLGTPEEMKIFWKAWDQLPFANMPLGH